MNRTRRRGVHGAATVPRNHTHTWVVPQGLILGAGRSWGPEYRLAAEIPKNGITEDGANWSGFRQGIPLFDKGCEIGLNAIKDAELRWRARYSAVFTGNLQDLVNQQLLGDPLGPGQGDFLAASYRLTGGFDTFEATACGNQTFTQIFNGGTWQTRCFTLRYPGNPVGGWQKVGRIYAPATAGLLSLADLVDLGDHLGMPLGNQLRSFTTSPETVHAVFTRLDANHDGTLTPAEMLGNSGVPPDLLTLVRTGFHLLNDEELAALPGITEADLTGDLGPPLISYPTLRAATTEIVVKPGVGHALSVKLDAAEAAEASGDTAAKAQAIQDYLNQLQAQSGKSLTGRESHALAVVARQL